MTDIIKQFSQCCNWFNIGGLSLLSKHTPACVLQPTCILVPAGPLVSLGKEIDWGFFRDRLPVIQGGSVSHGLEHHSSLFCVVLCLLCLKLSALGQILMVIMCHVLAWDFFKQKGDFTKTPYQKYQLPIINRITHLSHMWVFTWNRKAWVKRVTPLILHNNISLSATLCF